VGGLSAGVRHRNMSAASGADSDTRVVSSGAEKIACVAVGEGSSGVVRWCRWTLFQGLQWRWRPWHRRCNERQMGRQSRWRRRSMERREKEIIHLPLVPHQCSLASSLHCLPHLLSKRWRGDRRRAWKRGLWDRCSGGECSGDECSGDKGLGGDGSDTGGSDSESSCRGDGKFPLGCGGAPGAVEASSVAATGFTLSPTVVF
jgi:hypothetical protein